MVKYKANWIKSHAGNAIKSGDELRIIVIGVQYISLGIYKDNLPIMADFAFGEKIVLPMKVRDKSFFGRWYTRGLKKGKYTIKVRGPANGWNDEFEVI